MELKNELAQLLKTRAQLEKSIAQSKENNKSFDDIRKQREAEAYDMRLLGNLQRLFIYEVVNPIMTMSWEIAHDLPDEPAEERSYFTYLDFIEQYSCWLVCQQTLTFIIRYFSSMATIYSLSSMHLSELSVSIERCTLSLA